MRVLVVAPGHAFSTLDVHDGLCAGLRANGIEVIEYPLCDTLESMDLLVGAARMMNIAPEKGYPDPFQMATMGIPGMAMAKRVEAVIIVHGLNVPASIPATLHRGGYTTALVCTESPYQTDHEANIAQFYDVVFTNDRAAVPLFVNNPPDAVHYLPHAWHPTRHTPDGPRAEARDVVFVGTRFPERAALLDGVDWTGIDYLERTIEYGGKAPTADLLGRITPNTQTAALYRAACIALCHHRTTAHTGSGLHIAAGAAESLNPRCYEIPAVGGFLVSDVRAELGEVFGAGIVPTYHDSASLENVCRYYLAHEAERAMLARRQHQAVQAHSWTARARTILGILAERRVSAYAA